MNRTALTAILSTGVLVGGFVGLAHADIRAGSPAPAGPDVNGIVATVETTLAGAGVPVDLPEVPALPAAPEVPALPAAPEVPALPAAPDVNGVAGVVNGILGSIDAPVVLATPVPDPNDVAATVESTLASVGVPADIPEAPAVPAAPALPDVNGVVATIENALDTVGAPVEVPLTAADVTDVVSSVEGTATAWGLPVGGLLPQL